jgi:hypothetical protein
MVSPTNVTDKSAGLQDTTSLVADFHHGALVCQGRCIPSLSQHTVLIGLCQTAVGVAVKTELL